MTEINRTSLAPRHRAALVEGSAITPGVVEARGYRTIETGTELGKLGFGRAQRNVPGLLIPVWGTAGSIATYQLRPDKPRPKKNGKPVKYETPAGSRMALDVHPMAREHLDDPCVPLFVTEGIRKGDALVSKELCAVALIGVWNWRGTNAKGGKVALPEWEDVALKRREVFVVFDSDVMLKPEVHAALSRLKGFLETRGAKVMPIYLPAAEGGEKQGVDDYLVSGPTVDDLLSLATTELRGPSTGTGSQTQAETLIHYADEADLFHTPDGEAFATVEVGGHMETWPLKSKRLRQWFLRRFYIDRGRAPSAQAMADALATVAARAMFDGPEMFVHTRVAKHTDRAIYLDLGNEKWEAVEVTSSGWRVVSSDLVPVKFVRKNNAAALPYPVGGGSIEILRSLLNVRSEEDFKLVVAWLIGAFNPDGPHPVLDLEGEQGSAKSTVARVLRSVVDPAVEPLRAPPRDERDLAIAASGNWTPAMDNLSGVKPWLSDALCRLATGGGFATRELYSDDREVIFSQKRPVILTGIDRLAVAGDLRDRSLIVELPPIPPEEKRTEREFYRQLEEARPLVLGALLDAASGALRNLDRVELEELPRMADFAMWVTAAEEALGWEPGAFMDAYAGNRSAATGLALDDDPVAVAVRELVSKGGEWSGTSTELLSDLGGLVDEVTRRSRSWPTAANTLSNHLNRIAPALREVGIEYKKHIKGREKKRVKTLRACPEKTVRPVRTARGGNEGERNDALAGGRFHDPAGDGRPATYGAHSADGPRETAPNGGVGNDAGDADGVLRTPSGTQADTTRNEGREADV
jgi:hypothetical protein